MKAAIIADDLTGACDSAVGFVRAGHTAIVGFHPHGRVGSTADVISIDTESRGVSDGEAARRVRDAIRDIGERPLLIKKLDSTLRGQVGAELKAALELGGRATAILAPAFPEYRRTTVEATQLLDGAPVHESAAGRDPIAPARTSRLDELLGGAGIKDVARLSRQELGDRGRLRSLLKGASVVIVDAETDRDLDLLVRSVEDPSSVLWAGSTGISRALGRALPGPGRPTSTPPSVERVLVVVGSLNPVSREQLEVLRRRGDVRYAQLVVTPTFNGEHPLLSPDIEGEDPGAITAIASDPLRLAPHPDSTTAAAVATGLAHMTSALVDKGVGGLVLTGGDTATAVARRLGFGGFRVLGEVGPGIPHGVIIGESELSVVTKAGGFGDPTALLRAATLLLDRGGLP